MDDYYNIFLLDCTVSREPKNYKSVKEEVISLLKANDFSLTDSARLFKNIIQDLGKTPMNEL